MDGIDEFGSFTVEPKEGQSDSYVIKKLGEVSGIKEIDLLVAGFISVRFEKPLNREQVREFKERTKNYARVNEKRLHQPHWSRVDRS